MNDKKEIEKIAKEICNYVASKNMTKVYVIGTKYNPLAFEFLHNTGIAEWLVKKGYRNVEDIIKEFAERIKMEFFYQFEELIPSIMADRIDDLVKEYCKSENINEDI